MDRILASQRMVGSDLLPAGYNARAAPLDEAESETVPVVSHHAALFEPFIRPSGVQSVLHLPDGILQTARARTSNARARPGSGLSRSAFRPPTLCRWSP
jgi:hypothetical protein